MKSLPRRRAGELPRGSVPDLDHALGRYRVRFARSDAERDEAFRLRFAVFNLELGEGLEQSFATQRDVDPFDAQCDHLLVSDERSGAVIGTYRLQVFEAAEAGSGFYSATEFDLSSLPREVLRDSIELGRACIAREHRSSRVLFLLWTGLAAYVLWNRKRYFFGCCSLTSQDPRVGLRALWQLERDGHVHPELAVRPLAGYECVADAGPDEIAAAPEVEIPALFGTYLRYGAKLCGPPAIDRFFGTIGTIDFLALLDVEAVDPRTFAQFAAPLLSGP
jgi:putative hemolysin